MTCPLNDGIERLYCILSFIIHAVYDGQVKTSYLYDQPCVHIDEITIQMNKHIRAIQVQPERVMSYFKHKKLHILLSDCGIIKSGLILQNASPFFGV